MMSSNQPFIIIGTCTVVINDFNAKLGREGYAGEKYIGKYSIRERNVDGNGMIAVDETNEVFWERYFLLGRGFFAVGLWDSIGNFGGGPFFHLTVQMSSCIQDAGSPDERSIFIHQNATVFACTLS